MDLVERIVEVVGRRIAEVRRRRGWTQEEAAERLGMSLRHLKRLEKGFNVTVVTLARLAKKLGVAPSALLVSPRSWAPRPPGRPKRRRMRPGTVSGASRRR